MKNFTKNKISFIALFLMLMMGTALLMTACQTSVNPSSPGVATVTKTPVNTATATYTPNVSLTPLPSGSIQFIGWARNGSAQFGFISPTLTLPTGTVIYFTDLSWDNTLNTGVGGFSDQSVSISSKQVEVEAVISCTLTSALSPNTPVFIGNTADATNSTGISVANIALFSNTTSTPNGGTLTGGVFTSASTFLKQSGQGNGDKIIAYTVPYGGSAPSAANNYQPTGTVFTTEIIFGPDAYSSSAITHYYDSGVATGLTSGTTALDLHQLWTDSVTNFVAPMQTAIAGGANENAMLNGTTCPSGAVYTNSNWIGSIVGASGFSLANAVTVANQGNVPCSGGYGFAPTPTVVMPY